MPISRADFGSLPDGRKAEIFTLTNRGGLSAKITNYGGRITSIITPDYAQNFDEITLGYDTLAPYLEDESYLGATIGRYANRMCGAQFTLEGQTFDLTANEGKNQLHGGGGFHSRLWEAYCDQNRLTLEYRSPAKDDGYPGNMDVTLHIYWDSDTDLRIDYHAVTDAPCPINLTNHAYFNLGDTDDISGHIAAIHAQQYLIRDDNNIPTGEITTVQNSSLDLRQDATIGHRFNACALPQGFDHSYVIDGQGLRRAATIYEPKNQRRVTLLTTQPGMQFYTGYHLDGAAGRDGQRLAPFAGLCLEGQHHPDSPNHPHFPDTILRPGETYQHTQIYRFETS